jgi:hypothetical protein
MSFPGPISISPINNTIDQNFGLRVSQRVTAQIVSVTGTTAILEVDGHPVVAQLTSADQAATLASQPTAQFIVTQLTDQSVTLKFIKNEQAQPVIVGIVANGPELAERMLESNNIPVTITNLMMTRSLLKQHLPVTPELLNELQSALSEYGDWGEAEADLAAAMKAAGLPLTGQSLALSARKPVQTADALSQLIATLTQAGAEDLPEEILKQLTSNLQTLHSLILTADGNSSQLADQLKAAVEAFGRSLENVLLEQIQNPEKSISEKSLASLVKLQNMLGQLGKQETARSIKEFLTDIHREQFMNVKPEPSRGYDEWAEIGFMIQSTTQKADEKFSSARLRIAREPKEAANKINPANTRLILQVDLQSGETVEVDLALAGKQIKTLVKSPDLAWCEQAQIELPSLTEALNELGYTLKDFQVDVETPQPFSRLQHGTGNINLMTVNIEI